jgi:DNA-binding beta-propeller fold protein YncE
MAGIDGRSIIVMGGSTVTTSDTARRTLAAICAALLVSVIGIPGAAAEDSPAAPELHRQLAVGGFGTPLISMVDVTRSGAKSLVPGSPYPTGLLPLALAITPNARTLYSTHAGSGTILGYRINSNGTLTPLPEATTVMGSPVIGAAITPDGARLFVTTGPTLETGSPGSVQSFTIGSSGSLTRTNAPAAPIDSSLSQVIVTPDARHLVVNNFLTDTMVSFAIGPDSRLTQVGDPLPTGERPAIPGISPDGRFIYVSNEGSGDLSGFSISATGELRPTPGSPYPVGLEPHGVVFTSDSRRVYAPDVGLADGALPGAGGAAIVGWRVEGDGRLVPLPDSPYPTPGLGGRVVLSPDDSRLFHVQSIATDNPLAHSFVHGYVLDAEGRPHDDGLPPVDTGIVFHDGTTAFFTPNQGPVADVELVYAAGKTRTFSAAESSDRDGRVVRYRWTFGDGTTQVTASPEVSHTYRTRGPWQVSVEVTDDEGCSTLLNFQGTTVTCGGGPAARATLTVR